MSRLSSESADLVEHFEDAVRRADRDLAGIDLAALELQIKAPWSPLDVVKLLIHVRDQVASARACLGEVIS